MTKLCRRLKLASDEGEIIIQTPRQLGAASADKEEHDAIVGRIELLQ